MPGTHFTHNGHVINDHLQAKNRCVSRAQWRADTFCVTSDGHPSPRHALKSKLNLAFFLPDTLAVRFLSSSFAFCFCKLQLPYLRIYFKAYA